MNKKNAYRAAVSRKMKNWSNAKLAKEDAFSKGDEHGWEGKEWRAALDAEIANRK